MTASSLPLEFVRVLDLSRVLAGPYCTMCLADLGADVIKIERPKRGDDTRHWGPPFVAGESAYFLCCNRNKRSLTLDLKTAEGRDIALRLAGRSDVVVENFRPGTMNRLGLGYEQMVEHNPGVVYCSISGFGQTGPLCNEPGYDILIQGLSGLMSITGGPNDGPMKVGVAIADINAGLIATSAILAALVSRQNRGRGERIDIALLDCAVASLANVASSHLLTGELPGRYGNAHPNIVPYQAFETADGMVIVAVGNDHQWRAFCQAFACRELASDSRFATNAGRVQHRTELLSRVQELVRRHKTAACRERLQRAGIPNGEVRDLAGAFEEPQLRSRNMVVTVDHAIAGSIDLVNTPFRFASLPVGRRSMPPPTLGEHNHEILEELGCSSDEIGTLTQDGIV